MTAMSVIQISVEFRGVSYVNSFPGRRTTPAAEKILTSLSLFCGSDYMPNLTIVPMTWDGLDKYGIEDKLSLIEQWKNAAGAFHETWSPDLSPWACAERGHLEDTSH